MTGTYAVEILNKHREAMQVGDQDTVDLLLPAVEVIREAWLGEFDVRQETGRLLPALRRAIKTEREYTEYETIGWEYLLRLESGVPEGAPLRQDMRRLRKRLEAPR